LLCVACFSLSERSYLEQKEKFVSQAEKAALDEENKRVQAAKLKEQEDAHREMKRKKDEEARQKMMDAAIHSGEKVANSDGNVDRKAQIINGGWGGRPAAAAAPTIAPASASSFSAAPAWGNRSSSTAEPAASKYTPPQAAAAKYTPPSSFPARSQNDDSPSMARPTDGATGGRWGGAAGDGFRDQARPNEGSGAVGGRWGGAAGDAPREGQQRTWGQSKPGDGAPRSGGWGK
jgi:hypothetical protein